MRRTLRVLPGSFSSRSWLAVALLAGLAWAAPATAKVVFTGGIVGPTGFVGVQTRDGNAGDRLVEGGLSLPVLDYDYSSSAAASAGVTSASGSAGMRCTGLLLHDDLQAIVLTANCEIEASTPDVNDRERNGAGGSMAAEARLAFSVTADTTAQVAVGGSGAGSFNIKGPEGTLVAGLVAQGATQEIQLRSGGSYTIEINIGASASLANRNFGGSASVSFDIRFLPSRAAALRALEVTQSVQDWNNSVPLIEGKPTVVRAYLEALDPNDPSDVGRRVNGRLRGYRNGTSELPGSPLYATVIPGFFDDHATLVPDAVAARNNSSGVYESLRRCSLNFVLPPSWTSGNVDLKFEADDAALEVRAPAERGDTPNTGVVRANFLPAPRLHVAVVPIEFRDLLGPGVTSPPSAFIQDVVHQAGRILPTAGIDVTPMETLTMRGETTALLSIRLLQALSDIRTDNLPQFDFEHRLILGVVSHDALTRYLSEDSNALVTGQSDGLNGWATADPGNLLTASHELGHALGRLHALRSDGTGLCGEAPFPGITPFPYFFPVPFIGAKPTLGPMADGDEIERIFGIDLETQLIANPNHYYELMSYCQPRWISGFTYKRIREQLLDNAGLPAAPAFQPSAAPATDYLLVRGMVNLNNGQVDWLPIRCRSGVPPALPPAGEFALQLRDTGGALLSETTFGLRPPDDAELGDAPFHAGFSIPFPTNSSARRVELRRNGVLLASQTASAHAPQVQVLSPNGGETANDQTLEVRWQAVDEDGDPLTFDVLYSIDDGSTWRTLVVDWPDTHIAVPATELRGSTRARVRVLAGDGFWCSADSSDGSFTIGDKSPRVRIRMPAAGATVSGLAPLVLEGNASDIEDGALSGASLEWHSDRDGLLGTGERLQLAAISLTEGEHELTLRARDQAGHVAVATNRFSVTRFPPPTLRLGEPSKSGSVAIEAYGTPVSRLTLEVSSNLVDWAPLLSQAQTHPVELLTDTQASASSSRFYRARAAAQPPEIFQETQTNFTGLAGTNLMLSVSALGQPPLTWQWYRNGVALSGQTNNTFTASNLLATQSGNYFVVISNNVGSVTGAVANVTILSQAFDVLHVFGPTNVEAINGWGRLTVARDGAIYGCARNGGPANGGGIFRFDPATANYRVLRLLAPATDGSTPLGGLIEGPDEALYGTASAGGTNSSGTIFKVNKDGGGFSVLRHLLATNDCRNPQAELLAASDGFLYGTAFNGGGAGRGGVFRVRPDGSEYSIVTGFGNSAPDAPRQPVGGLIEGRDHYLYGTSESGGSADKGAVFRLRTDGTYSVLKSLGLVTGGAVNPDGTLLELPAAPGLLVGTTANGGSANLGALFSILPDGDNFQIVHDFGVVAADGRNPTTGLVQAPNGWLLGTTRVGGAANQGVIYQVNPLVTSVTTVHTFTATAGDAARSRGALVSAGSGIYYGTTFGGGTNDQGALFRLFNP